MTLEERAKVAMLVAAVQHGVAPDIQEYLVAGDHRSVPPGALNKMARAAIDAVFAHLRTAMVAERRPVSRSAIAADLRAGMSLRKAAAKHGVGVGVVRGIASHDAP